MPSRFPRFQRLLLIFTLCFLATEIWSALRQSAFVPPQPVVSILPRPIEFRAWFPLEPAVVEDSDVLVHGEYRKLLVCDDRCPDLVDIVYRLENKGSQPASLFVLAVGEFRIPFNRQGTSAAEELLGPGYLVERQNIGQQVIYKLKPGEIREVTFTNLSIRDEMNKRLGAEYSRLQPWEFRVSINVETTEGRPVAESKTVLDLIPARGNSKRAPLSSRPS